MEITSTLETIIIRNPATGEVIREIPTTRPEELAEIYRRARTAQAQWAMAPLKKRGEALFRIRESLLAHTDELIETLVKENGKPKHEALINEILPTVDFLTYFAKRAPKLLKDRRIPLRIVK